MTADPPPPNRCGTYAGYQWHRRKKETACTPCKAANAADRRRRTAERYLTRGRSRMVDGTGTRRRIQALARIGWPMHELAARLGLPNRRNVYDFTSRETVNRRTADRIAVLYDELSMMRGPSTSAAKRAASKGWPPPLAYDDDTIDDPNARPASSTDGRVQLDDIAIQRAMRGGDVRLRPAERAEAVRRLTAMHLSAAEIAERLSITKRSVVRLRSGKAA